MSIEKTISREVTFRALFQMDFVSCAEDELEFYTEMAIENALNEEEFPEVEKLARRHINRAKIFLGGTLANLEKIDEIIKAYLKKGWDFSRLAVAEKNILRLAVFELKFDPAHLDAPIIINEAVNLAKKYGSTDRSEKFINGILNAISSEKKVESNISE